MRFLTALIFSLVLLACAQVVAPTGGIEDSIPPTILKTQPENQSLNFNAKNIQIEFDEYIKLQDLKKQLIVSPPLKYNLETSIAGKTLKIKTKDTLLENTTYVLNFGNAIVDITENNPIINYQYVFSTGQVIDSLSIKGKVVNARSLKAADGMLVMLYDTIDNDSIPYQSVPKYLGRSNADGDFLITNLKAGKYKLFALKDGNNNFLFDRPDEEIAFLESYISIEKNIDSIKLFSFVEKNQKQFIESETEKKTQLILDFKLALSSLHFELLDTAELLHYYINNRQDSAFFWWKERPKSKISLAISDDTLFSDTIKFNLDSLGQKSKLRLEKPPRKIQNYFAPIPLQFERPIASVNKQNIIVMSNDSSTLDFELNDAQHPSLQTYLLNFAFEEDSNYLIQILPGAFVDIYQRTTDTLWFPITFNKASDFGNLEVTIRSPYAAQKIVQLLKGKNQIISEKIILQEDSLAEDKVEFNNLDGGKYKLKLIIDERPNGKWDTGDYLKAEQAEKVIFFDEEIRIRSNWDKEIEWIIK